MEIITNSFLCLCKFSSQ